MSVHTADPEQIQQNLEAAIRESWENWCVDDVQEEREEKQDKKRGPQTLSAYSEVPKHMQKKQAVWGIQGGKLMQFRHLTVDMEQRLGYVIQVVT